MHGFQKVSHTKAHFSLFESWEKETEEGEKERNRVPLCWTFSDAYSQAEPNLKSREDKLSKPLLWVRESPKPMP